jgi:hypothetical protein
LAAGLGSWLHFPLPLFLPEARTGEIQAREILVKCKQLKELLRRDGVQQH